MTNKNVLPTFSSFSIPDSGPFSTAPDMELGNVFIPLLETTHSLINKGDMSV